MPRPITLVHVDVDVQTSMMHMSFHSSIMGRKKKHKNKNKNKPSDHQIFADNFDEDFGGMEGQGGGAEERRELTGTSFQYQRVGHCQREAGIGKRKTRKRRTGAQGQVLSLQWRN